MCIYVCTSCACSALRGQKGALDFRKWSYRQLWATTWVLEIKPTGGFLIHLQLNKEDLCALIRNKVAFYISKSDAVALNLRPGQSCPCVLPEKGQSVDLVKCLSLKCGVPYHGGCFTLVVTLLSVIVRTILELHAVKWHSCLLKATSSWYGIHKKWATENHERNKNNSEHGSA